MSNGKIMQYLDDELDYAEPFLLAMPNNPSMFTEGAEQELMGWLTGLEVDPLRTPLGGVIAWIPALADDPDLPGDPPVPHGWLIPQIIIDPLSNTATLDAHTGGIAIEYALAPYDTPFPRLHFQAPAKGVNGPGRYITHREAVLNATDAGWQTPSGLLIPGAGALPPRP